MLNVQEIINKSIRDKNEANKKETKNWYASSLGVCQRGLMLKRLGIEPLEEMDDRLLRVFDVGNQMEDWLVDLLAQDHSLSVQTQIRIEDKDLDVSGKCDAILTRGKEKEVLEVKTKHSKAFWWMLKTGQPMRQHEMQLWLYLYKLDIDKGTILYLSKDDLAIQQYVVYRNDKALEGEVLTYLGELNKAWKEKNILLLPLVDPKSWQAKYCNMHDKCCDEEFLKTLSYDKK